MRSDSCCSSCSDSCNTKINLDKYIIVNYWSKLLPNGKFTSSVFSKKKEAKDYTAEDFAKFLENYKPNYIPQPQPKQEQILIRIHEHNQQWFPVVFH